MNVILLTVASRLFGIEADRVSQVEYPPLVTPIPFMPEHVEGLVNVGGAVLVSIDLARLLGEQGAAADHVTMVVSSGTRRFALKVDRVQMMVPVDPADLNPLTSADHHGVIAAEFRWQDRMVLMLDPDAMDLGEAEAGREGGSSDFILAAAAEPADTAAAAAAAERLPSLLVQVGSERYALNVAAVTEVVESGDFLPVPKAPPEVVGYHSLRGQPLLVTSLAGLMGGTAGPVGHVVIVGTGSARIGLGVDRVVGIRTLDTQAAEDVGDSTGMVAGCVVEGDGAMLAVLDLGHVLTDEVMTRLAEYIPQTEHQGIAAATAPTEKRRLLTFWLGDELCGIDLERVSRVAEAAAWSELPQDPIGGLNGITQVGNDVMPVIDLRHSIGARASAPPRAQVVATVGGATCALAVDRMHRILDIPVDDIRAIDDHDRALIDGVGRADGHLVSLVAVDALMGEGAPC